MPGGVARAAQDSRLPLPALGAALLPPRPITALGPAGQDGPSGPLDLACPLGRIPAPGGHLLIQHSHPCEQEPCPCLGLAGMGQGCSHPPPPKKSSPPHTAYHSLGLIPMGPGAEAIGLLFGFFFPPWGIDEMEKLLRREMAKNCTWWVGLGQSDLVTTSEPGLLEAWPVHGRWEAGGRGVPVCLEHGALLGNWDKGMPQGQRLQV